MKLALPLLILTGLVFLVLAAGSHPAGAIPAQEEASLIRLVSPDESVLRWLADQEAPVLASDLLGEDGQVYLFLLASPKIEASLRQKYVQVDVLDPTVDGDIYSLLFFPTDLVLAAAGDVGQVLWHDSSHALLQTSEDADLEFILQAGGTIRTLTPHPLVIRDEAPRAVPPVVYSPAVQLLINQVESYYVSDDIGSLSGEWAVMVGGSPYTFDTRFSRTTTQMEKVTQYVYERFQEMGYSPEYDSYTLPSSGTRRNVVVEKRGTTQPNRIFVLTAHLDSYSVTDPYNDAPGADDNASGSAGVLIAADIMSQVDFGCTLRYVLFTGEEQGYYGSAEYAQNAASLGDPIEAVFNLDMIGYDANLDGVIELHTRPGNGSDLALAYLFRDVVTAYGIDFTTQILQDGLSWSDHASFWDYGFPAILAMEDYQELTPAYHTAGDRLSTLNMTYTSRFVKAAIAALAHAGCGVAQPTATPTKTATPTHTFTPSVTPTPTRTPTPTATFTPFPTFADPKFNYLPLIRRDQAPPTPTPTNTPPPSPTPTRTPTVTSPPPGCTNLVSNGGFESSSAWTLVVTEYTAGYVSSPTHSGAQALRVGITNSGENKLSYSSARQEIPIPGGADSVELQFWWYPRSGEARVAQPVGLEWESQAAQAYHLAGDAQYVYLFNAKWQIIATLMSTVQNDQEWEYRSFDLSPYAGQTVYLYFGAYNDGAGGSTGYFLDDVSIQVCGTR